MKMLGTVLLTLHFFAQSVIQNSVLNAPNRTTQELNELAAANHDVFLFTRMASVLILAAAVLTEIPYIIGRYPESRLIGSISAFCGQYSPPCCFDYNKKF